MSRLHLEIFLNQGLNIFCSQISERDMGQSHTTVRVTGFEPDVFRQLMEFAHTGRVDLMPRTIIGVICAADYYQFTGIYINKASASLSVCVYVCVCVVNFSVAIVT